ncbi:MAG: mycothiol synthase [Angustibacter sp.]
MAGQATRVRWSQAAVLDASQLAAVLELTASATEADGLHPLSEHVVLHLPLTAPAGDLHLLAWEASRTDHSSTGQRLVGYAHLDPTDAVHGASGEVVVHPDWRGRGVGRLLVERLRELSSDGRLRLWAHGRRTEAHALATALGYVQVREVWQMRRSLRAQLPQVDVPAGYALRTFRPGADEAAWVALNAAAFAGHPEQGHWTLADLRHRMSEPWFDPAGFFLLVAPDGELAGFHWTKVHAHDTHPDSAHQPIGEVYVVGVAPGHRGQRLGEVLTVAGLRHLRSSGLSETMLYVDTDNHAAVRTYQRLGFSWWDTDVQYSAPTHRDVQAPSG